MVRILQENDEPGRTVDRLSAVIEASKKDRYQHRRQEKRNVTIGGSEWLREKS
jgi:hypothetical protein